MNSKILLAFLGGALLASGIVYMAVKPDSKPETKIIVDTSKSKPAPADPADTDAQATAPEQRSPVVSEVTRPERRREKMREERHNSHKQSARPEAHNDKPLQIAQATPPASPSLTPAPVTSASAPPTPAIADPTPAQPVSSPAPPPPASDPPKPEPPQPHSVTLTAGTPLSVRIGETLTTQRNKPGDTFVATLDQPLVIDGFVIAERGSRCEGRVVESDPGGRVRGVAHLGVELTSLHTSDGQRIKISTAAFGKDADTSRRQDAEKVGGGAALGAIIGAIAGGGRGAGIGTAAGGAAGAGDVMMTRGKPAELKVETRVSFRVQQPVTITEKLE